LYEVIFKIFCHPRICVSVIFYRQSVGILGAMWNFVFSNYKRWQFIAIISIAKGSAVTRCLDFIPPWKKIYSKTGNFARI
jgi:hypothetical protein